MTGSASPASAWTGSRTRWGRTAASRRRPSRLPAATPVGQSGPEMMRVHECGGSRSGRRRQMTRACVWQAYHSAALASCTINALEMPSAQRRTGQAAKQRSSWHWQRAATAASGSSVTALPVLTAGFCGASSIGSGCRMARRKARSTVGAPQHAWRMRAPSSRSNSQHSDAHLGRARRALALLRRPLLPNHIVCCSPSSPSCYPDKCRYLLLSAARRRDKSGASTSAVLLPLLASCLLCIS